MGVTLVCFLKNFVKEAASKKFKEFAISDIVMSVASKDFARSVFLFNIYFCNEIPKVFLNRLEKYVSSIKTKEERSFI